MNKELKGSNISQVSELRSQSMGVDTGVASLIGDYANNTEVINKNDNKKAQQSGIHLYKTNMDLIFIRQLRDNDGN